MFSYAPLTINALPFALNAGFLLVFKRSLGWEIPWGREQLPTLVFWPGESHRQQTLAGYGPWGHKKSVTTERLSL